MTKKTSGNARPETERHNIIPQKIYKSYIQPELSDLPESILHTMMNAYLDGQVRNKWFEVFRWAMNRALELTGTVRNPNAGLGSGDGPHDYVYRALAAYYGGEPAADLVVTALVLLGVFHAMDDDIALYTSSIEKGGAA